MTRLLQVGDVFTTTAALVGTVAWKPSGEPFVDASKLRPRDSGGQRATCPWTERGRDGWERKRETVLDIAVDAAGARWVVLAAKMATARESREGRRDERRADVLDLQTPA